MAWVKLDDQFFRHPKAVEAGRDGRDLYIASLCYCGSALTDGVIPGRALRILAADAEIDDAAEAAERLVAVGLWVRTSTGFMVHDYHDYNPTKERVLATRDARAEAGSKGGKQKSSKLLDAGYDVASDTSQAKSNPVPVPRPLPVEIPVDDLGTGGSGGDSELAADEHAADAAQPESDPDEPQEPTEETTDALPGTDDAPPSSEAPSPAQPVPKPEKDPPGFPAFWLAYPNKTDRKAAVEQWQRLKPNSELQGAILAAVEAQKRGRKWQDPRYVKAPHRWLRDRNWHDETETEEMPIRGLDPEKYKGGKHLAVRGMT